MRTRELASTLVSAILLVVALIPSVSAVTATASITITPPSCNYPSCTSFSAQGSVPSQTACPFDGHYTGTLSWSFGATLLETVTQTDVACNGSFPPLPVTLPIASFTCGTYTAEFSGTTYNVDNTELGTFNLTQNYTVSCASPVPEFGVTVVALASVLFVALSLVRRKTLTSPSQSL